MADFLVNVTAVITAALSWLTSTVTEVVKASNVLLLFFILIPMIGAGIGLLKRMVK